MSEVRTGDVFGKVMSMSTTGGRVLPTYGVLLQPFSGPLPSGDLTLGDGRVLTRNPADPLPEFASWRWERFDGALQVSVVASVLGQADDRAIHVTLKLFGRRAPEAEEGADGLMRVPGCPEEAALVRSAFLRYLDEATRPPS